MTKRTPAVSSTSVPEFPEWNDLSQAFATYAIGVTHRTQISAEDRETLASLVPLHAAYLRAARAAWAASPIALPEIVDDAIGSTLGTALSDFATLNSGETKLEVAHLTLPVPAITHPAVRTAIVDAAANITRQLEAALQAGRNRIAQAEALGSRIAAQVRYWLAYPALRGIVQAVLVMRADQENLGPGNFYLYCAPALQTFAVLQMHYRPLADNPPEILNTGGGSWMQWLDEAARQLNEE